MATPMETRTWANLAKRQLRCYASELGVANDAKTTVIELRRRIEGHLGIAIVEDAEFDVYEVDGETTRVVRREPAQAELVVHADAPIVVDDQGDEDGGEVEFEEWLKAEKLTGPLRQALTKEVACTTMWMAENLSEAALVKSGVKPLHCEMIIAARDRLRARRREAPAAAEAKPAAPADRETGYQADADGRKRVSTSANNTSRLHGKITLFDSKKEPADLQPWLARYSLVTEGAGWTDEERIKLLCGYVEHRGTLTAYRSLRVALAPGTSFDDFVSQLCERVISPGERSMHTQQYHELCQTGSVKAYHEALLECFQRINPDAKEYKYDKDSFLIGKFTAGLKPQLKITCTHPVALTLVVALARALTAEHAWAQTEKVREEQDRRTREEQDRRIDDEVAKRVQSPQ